MKYKEIQKPNTILPHYFFSKSLNTFVEINSTGTITLHSDDLISLMDHDVNNLIEEQTALGYSTLKSYLIDLQETEQTKQKILKGQEIISILNLRFNRLVKDIANTEVSKTLLTTINKIYNEVKIELSTGDFDNASLLLSNMSDDIELANLINQHSIAFNQEVVRTQIISIVDLIKSK